MLNEVMDGQCKRFWKETKHESQVNFAEDWSIWIGEDKVSSNLTKTIWQYCSIVWANRYWRDKLGAAATQIDWEGTGMVMKPLPQGRWQWIIKQSSGFCSVG
jgi:hypothetical protein